MWKTQLQPWQRDLIDRLERGLDRPLTASDLGCIAWDLQTETLTVETQPLRRELRTQNLISNVFRGTSARRG